MKKPLNSTANVGEKVFLVVHYLMEDVYFLALGPDSVGEKRKESLPDVFACLARSLWYAS